MGNLWNYIEYIRKLWSSRHFVNKQTLICMSAKYIQFIPCRGVPSDREDWKQTHIEANCLLNLLSHTLYTLQIFVLWKYFESYEFRIKLNNEEERSNHVGTHTLSFYYSLNYQVTVARTTHHHTPGQVTPVTLGKVTSEFTDNTHKKPHLSSVLDLNINVCWPVRTIGSGKTPADPKGEEVCREVQFHL